MSPRVLSARGVVRSFGTALLLCALFTPVLGAGAELADDLADLASPTDDPKTPCPDLYGGRNLDIPDMPELVAMALPISIGVLAEPVTEPLCTVSFAPSAVSRDVEPGSNPRAPPALLS
jgi:hypothetical protein